MADENNSIPSYIKKDLMDFENELLNAKEAPKEQQPVEDKKAALILIKKGILAYLKKGYSVQAVFERINEKFPAFGITREDVKKILPKVTKKKRAASAKAPNNVPGGKHEKIYFDVPYDDNGRIKALGAKFDNDLRKWYVPEDVDPKKFEGWVPKN